MLSAEGPIRVFSATVNFAGSAALGASGVATLAKVKNRRELLFAAMPLLFAIHQFIEGNSQKGDEKQTLDSGKKMFKQFPPSKKGQLGLGARIKP